MRFKFFIFYFIVILSAGSGVLTACLIVAWLVPRETVLPSRRKFCAHHTSVHQSVSCSPSHFIQSHIASRVRVRQFNCNLHMTFRGRMTRASFTCYCGNTGPVERIPKQKSAQNLTPEQPFVLPLLQGLKPGTFRSWVRCSIPAPLCHTHLKSAWKPISKKYCGLKTTTTTTTKTQKQKAMVIISSISSRPWQPCYSSAGDQLHHRKLVLSSHCRAGGVLNQ